MIPWKDKGTWITVNGRHILIKSGQSKSDAIADAFGGRSKPQVDSPVGDNWKHEDLPGISKVDNATPGTQVYFRSQSAGVSFEKMKDYKSKHEGSRLDGVAATMSAGGNEGGGGTFGGAPMDNKTEVVIFEGKRVGKIYDGYIVKPVREVARFSAPAYLKMIKNKSAWEYERYD